MKHTCLFVAAMIGGLPVASAQVDAQTAGAARVGGSLVKRGPAPVVHDDLTRYAPAWQARQALDEIRGAAPPDRRH